MLILDTTNRSLTVEHDGYVAAQFSVHYADIDATTFVPGVEHGITNGTSEVELLSAPASGKYRQVKGISLHNPLDGYRVFTVSLKDSQVKRTVVKAKVPGLYTLEFVDAAGWRMIDAYGTFVSGVGRLYDDGYNTGASQALADAYGIYVPPAFQQGINRGTYDSYQAWDGPDGDIFLTGVNSVWASQFNAGLQDAYDSYKGPSGSIFLEGYNAGTNHGLDLCPDCTYTIDDLSGVDNLHAVIDGVTAEQRMVATDWTLASWGADGYGSAFASASSGTDPNYAAKVPFQGTSDGYVEMEGGEVYVGPNNTLCDIDSEDAVIELVIAINADMTGNYRVFAKREASTLDGWAIFATVGISGDMTLHLEFDSATKTVISSCGVTPNTVMHVLCFIDRSGNAQMYIDGVLVGSTDISGQSAQSLTSAIPLCIGGRATDYAFKGKFRLSYFAFWKDTAGWLDPTRFAAIARARYHKLISGTGPGVQES